MGRHQRIRYYHHQQRHNQRNDNSAKQRGILFNGNTGTINGNGKINHAVYFTAIGNGLLTAKVDNANIAEAHTVRVEFEQPTYTLTASTPPAEAVTATAVYEMIPTPILPSQLATGNRAVQTYNGINLTATSNATVEIYGLNGNLVIRQNFANGVYAIQLGHLPKGLYIAKVSFGNGKEILRVPVR